MRFRDVGLAVVAVWALSALTVALESARVTSLTDVLALTIFGVWPPLGIWFRLNDPSDTLSASIHRIRAECRAPRHHAAQ